MRSTRGAHGARERRLERGTWQAGFWERDEACAVGGAHYSAPPRSESSLSEEPPPKSASMALERVRL